LRYSVQLMMPSYVIAKSKGRDEIDVDDVEESAQLFVSMKESARYLKELEKMFLK
ncbi:MAG: TATA box-binding protein, partial [Thermoprotei archaeon]